VFISSKSMSFPFLPSKANCPLFPENLISLQRTKQYVEFDNTQPKFILVAEIQPDRPCVTYFVSGANRLSDFMDSAVDQPVRIVEAYLLSPGCLNKTGEWQLDQLWTVYIAEGKEPFEQRPFIYELVGGRCYGGIRHNMYFEDQQRMQAILVSPMISSLNDVPQVPWPDKVWRR